MQRPCQRESLFRDLVAVIQVSLEIKQNYLPQVSSPTLLSLARVCNCSRPDAY